MTREFTSARQSVLATKNVVADFSFCHLLPPPGLSTSSVVSAKLSNLLNKLRKNGAGDGTQTHGLRLGKVLDTQNVTQRNALVFCFFPQFFNKLSHQLKSTQFNQNHSQFLVVCHHMPPLFKTKHKLFTSKTTGNSCNLRTLQILWNSYFLCR